MSTTVERTSASPATVPTDARRTRRATVGGLLVLIGVTALAGLLSLALGSRYIPLDTVVRVLLSPDGSDAATVLHGLRLPRTLLVLAVGLALGVAGALMQGHTRNPLADPGLLGVTAGASFAVVLGIFAFGITTPAGYAWLALVGAGLAAAAVFAIASTRGGPNPISLVLAGAAVSALLAALTQAMVLRDTQTLNDYRFWAVGSAAGRDMGVVVQVAPYLLLGLVLAAVSAPGLNLLQLGDDVARSLGMHPLRHKILGITTVMLLTGAATAACGPIGFVGLVVPHVARYLAGVDYRWILPYSGFIGAILVALADVVGRLLVQPAELQVGIVMALIGGPVFVVLVRRTRLVRL